MSTSESSDSSSEAEVSSEEVSMQLASLEEQVGNLHNCNKQVALRDALYVSAVNGCPFR